MLRFSFLISRPRECYSPQWARATYINYQPRQSLTHCPSTNPMQTFSADFFLSDDSWCRLGHRNTYSYSVLFLLIPLPVTVSHQKSNKASREPCESRTPSFSSQSCPGDDSIFYQFLCQLRSFQGLCPCYLHTLLLAFKCLKFLIFLCDAPLSHSQYQQGIFSTLPLFFLSSLPTQWVRELSISLKINFVLIEFFWVCLLN